MPKNARRQLVAQSSWQTRVLLSPKTQLLAVCFFTLFWIMIVVWIMTQFWASHPHWIVLTAGLCGILPAFFLVCLGAATAAVEMYGYRLNLVEKDLDNLREELELWQESAKGSL